MSGSDDACPVCLSAGFHRLALRVGDAFDGTEDPMAFVQGEIIARCERLLAELPGTATWDTVRRDLRALRAAAEDEPERMLGCLAELKTNFVDAVQAPTE
jgi:hypothetical protein